jgi:hypothetical protein
VEVCEVDKYKILQEKLKKLQECIAQMKVSDEATKRYLAEFEDYVNKLIAASCERKLHNSHGALLGLTRGISDYDELCANDELWECVRDADSYYSIECNVF